MMQQLRAQIQRLERSAARVAASAPFGFTTAHVTTRMWTLKPSVHTIPAICTHGNTYLWRLQEMPT